MMAKPSGVDDDELVKNEIIKANTDRELCQWKKTPKYNSEE